MPEEVLSAEPLCEPPVEEFLNFGVPPLWPLVCADVVVEERDARPERLGVSR